MCRSFNYQGFFNDTATATKQRGSFYFSSVIFIYIGENSTEHQRISFKTTGSYGGTKVTWKIYFILRAHAVANTCARISYYMPSSGVLNLLISQNGVNIFI